MRKTSAPSLGAAAFDCPVCGAFSDQYWYLLGAISLTARGKKPEIARENAALELFNNLGLADGSDKSNAAVRARKYNRAKSGVPHILPMQAPDSYDSEVVNLHASLCRSCGEISIWRYDQIIYPNCGGGIAPHPDLPDELRTDFDEARSVLELSPRSAAALLRLCLQKLCKHLGLPGRHLDSDIAELARQGLDPAVRQALDIVRVIGNQAVHPGSIDLNDNRNIAAKLYDLINIIVHDRITRPREIEALYQGLPAGALDAIKRRDSSE